MCAILGFIGLDSHPKYDPHLLSHRGPNGYKQWVSPNSEFPTFFAHHRLNVVDPSEMASQPFHSHDGRYVFNYNGEIFNYRQLKVDLIKGGVCFNTSSDTEVFLNGMIQGGMDFQKKCNGMWAFCLWDRYEQVAYLGRDRYGEKPLYYTSISDPLYGNYFAYASEWTALLPFLRSVDPHRNLKEMLSVPFYLEANQECLIDGIFRVPPGHFIEYSKSNIRVVRWWQTLDYLTIVNDPYLVQVENFQHLLTHSVRLRGTADIPISATCSGGLDSSSVLSILAKENMGISDAFTMRYPNTNLDEGAWSQKICSDLSLKLHEISVQIPSFDEVLGGIEILGDPFIDLGNPMIDLYQQISRAGYHVSLDGHGADELCGGYFELTGSLTVSSYKKFSHFYKLQKELSSSSVTNNSCFTAWLTHLSTRALIPIKNILRGPYKTFFKGLDFDFLESFCTPHYINHPFYQQMDSFNKRLYDLFHFSTLPTLLRNYDRYSMASGVEVRSPFLDYRLVNYGFSLPSVSKIGDGYTKRILRDSMKGVLPEGLRLRKDKVSWRSPSLDWFLNNPSLRGNLFGYFKSRSNELGVRSMAKLGQSQDVYPVIAELWKSLFLP
jgi:asparagine synthase (glutamine-hydrolysing)